MRNILAGMGFQHLTPEERRIAGKVGAESLWSQTTDKSKQTANARQANFSRYYDIVDPERVLSPPQREAMAQHAQRAELQKLALKSRMNARKRAERAEQIRAADQNVPATNSRRVGGTDLQDEQQEAEIPDG
jgi:hypothetical protein